MVIDARHQTCLNLHERCAVYTDVIRGLIVSNKLFQFITFYNRNVRLYFTAHEPITQVG